MVYTTNLYHMTTLYYINLKGHEAINIAPVHVTY